MVSLRKCSSMSPERDKYVEQSGTLIVMWERVRSFGHPVWQVWSCPSKWNLYTVQSPSQRMRRKRTSNPGREASDTNFMWGRMADRSQDFRGATGERPSEVFFTQLVQKQASCTFLPFVLWDFIKCVITVQPTSNIKCIRSVKKGHGGGKKFVLPEGRERK